MDLKQFAMGVAEDAAAIAIVEALGVVDMLSRPNDTDWMRWMKASVAWTLADEGVLLFKHGTSHLLQGEYALVADNTIFNGWVFGAVEKSGVGLKVADAVDGISPLPANINDAVASGLVKLGAKTVQDLIDTQWSGTPLSYITHPTRLLPQ